MEPTRGWSQRGARRDRALEAARRLSGFSRLARRKDDVIKDIDQVVHTVKRLAQVCKADRRAYMIIALDSELVQRNETFSGPAMVLLERSPNLPMLQGSLIWGDAPDANPSALELLSCLQEYAIVRTTDTGPVRTLGLIELIAASGYCDEFPWVEWHQVPFILIV